MANVCQKCGVVGCEELLIYCCICHKAAEHQYCFDTLPTLDENIEWSCEDCKNEANLHAHEDHEIKAWIKTRRRSIRSRKHIFKAYANSSRDGATCSKPPNGRRRKLVLSDEEDDDMIDDIAKVSLLEREINILEKNINIDRSFAENKHNDHERKLALSGEEDEDNNLEAKETMIFSKNIKMKDFDVETVLQRTFDETSTKIKSDNYLLRWGTLSVLARPISWRGWFKICGRAYGPLIAHLSPKVCEKAWNATRSLPQIIPLSIVSRSQTWPRNFESSPPTYDHIALFFFPPDSRVEEMVDQLIEEVIRCDLMLKVALDEAELLIFPSNLLPVDYNRYQDKYYLWGVFKRKDSNTNTGDITMPQTNENSFKKPAPNALIRYEGAQIEKVNKDMVLEDDERPESLCHLTDEDVIKEMGNDRGEDEELSECLELFPTQVENIGLRLKMGDRKKGVDVELCLGLPLRQ